MMRNNEMLKKRMLKSSVAMALSAAMLFGAVNLPALHIGSENAYAADYDIDVLSIKALILQNTNVLNVSVQRMVPEDINFFASIGKTVAPLGQLGGAYNSATTILKLTGIMKDPTAESLAKISNTLEGMTANLKNMNESLNTIANKLNAIDVTAKENHVEATTKALTATANNFFQQQRQPLDDLMTRYQDMMHDGFEDWFADSQKDAIKIETAGLTLNADQVTEAMKGKVYNVNSYRKVIINTLADEIISCANRGVLTADYNFYASWQNMTAAEKAEKAAFLAEECYNTLANITSYKVINASRAGRDFVTDVYNAFKAYCKAIIQEDSPIDAQIKVLYLTHAFESQIRENIYDVIDTATITTGTYATMALSLLEQCEAEPDSRVAEATDYWTSATDHLKNVRKNAVTGYDNYCYITNSLVNYATRDLHYSNSLRNKDHMEISAFTNSYLSDSFSTEDLLLDGDKVMANSEVTMLYHLYEKNAANGESFYQFLGNTGTGATEDSNTRLVTEYNGWTDFSPSEGLEMNYGYYAELGGTDCWGKEFQTIVNKGNNSHVKNENFKNCKKATATVFDPTTGQSKVNQVIGAMATYKENHWYWFTDEMYIMGYADSCSNNFEIEEELFAGSIYNNYSNYTTTCAVLLMSEVPKQTEETVANPLEAFDECQIVADVADADAAVHTEYEHTDVNPDPAKKIVDDQLVDPTAPETTPATGQETKGQNADPITDQPAEETPDPETGTPAETEEVAAPEEVAEVATSVAGLTPITAVAAVPEQ